MSGRKPAAEPPQDEPQREPEPADEEAEAAMEPEEAVADDDPGTIGGKIVVKGMPDDPGVIRSHRVTDGEL